MKKCSLVVEHIWVQFSVSKKKSERKKYTNKTDSDKNINKKIKISFPLKCSIVQAVADVCNLC